DDIARNAFRHDLAAESVTRFQQGDLPARAVNPNPARGGQARDSASHHHQVFRILHVSTLARAGYRRARRALKCPTHPRRRNPLMTEAQTPKKYWIWTVGCQMNKVDSDRVADTLQARGYVAAASEEEADIVVLNSSHGQKADPIA